jgi:cellulose synthase (UDP-forming)
VDHDLACISADLTEIPGVPGEDASHVSRRLAGVLEDPAARTALAGRDTSPLAAIAAVRELLLGVDLDRSDEAQPLMPMSTISVTEDMATAMRLHAHGWRSVYHHEVLARGLAPEDLRSMLQQRLRWAQGTIQVLLRENPLCVRGLSLGQRLMYLGTMWSYFSGFFAPIYLMAPVLYLVFGLVPVRAMDTEFLAHLLPYLAANQLLFAVVGRGMSTWRGQQYSLALFPLWVRAVLTATQNVWLGAKLGFVVTPKTHQGVRKAPWALVRPQLVVMAVLGVAILAGAVRLAAGDAQGILPLALSIAWCVYDLCTLWVVVPAARYRPFDRALTEPVRRLDSQPPHWRAEIKAAHA